MSNDILIDDDAGICALFEGSSRATVMKFLPKQVKARKPLTENAVGVDVLLPKREA
jgi:hypothetical protein